MNDDIPLPDAESLQALAKVRAVLELPGMEDVRVLRNIGYSSRDGEELGIDVYQPEAIGRALPAVVFVTGYSDKGAMDLFGLRLKDWGCYVSWGQLAAASGLVGMTCSCIEPPEDMKDVLTYVRQHSAELNIDPERIGICAFSGNGPTALALLMDPEIRLRFAVMCNTYMLDLDGDTAVADMAAQIGFSAPNAGKSIRDLDREVPMLIVRSGRDQAPGLNQSLDRFATHAIAANLPVRLVNLPDAPHGFDTQHDTEESRVTVREILNFVRAHSELRL